MFHFIATHPHVWLIAIGILLLIVALRNTYIIIKSLDKSRSVPWVLLELLIGLFIIFYLNLMRLFYLTENIQYDFLTIVFLCGAFFVYLATRVSVTTVKALMQLTTLRREADYDYLTNIHNRRYFIKEFVRVLNLIKRNGPKSVLLMVDLDNFKCINDNYGHAEGDAVLKKFAGILKKGSRKSDIVARFGGDEFTVLLYNSTSGDAMLKIQEYRSKLQAFIEQNYPDCRDINCAAGMVEIDEHTENIDAALKAADDRCYREKEKQVARKVTREEVRPEEDWT